MTPERWHAVKTAFLDVVALSEEERVRYFDTLEKADNDVPAIVQALLNQSSVGPDLFQCCWSAGASPPPPNVFSPGRLLLDRFQIGAFLGAGGLGEVYRAFDHQQSCHVALKTMRADAAGDAALTLLRKELNTARSVTHPNVCRLHDFHISADRDAPPFFTMELLEGETLTQFLKSKGPLAEADALPLLDQMFDGLAAIHRAGVIHRDFKTSNVMVTEEGQRAVVMDFGLARDLNLGPDSLNSLATGNFAGTPA